MLISLTHINEIGFDQLLLAILVFNILIVAMLTFVPDLHRKLAHWIWPKRSRL